MFAKSSHDNRMPVSSRISLASLYNQLCHFQSENVFKRPVTLRGKAVFHIQATNSLKHRRFDEKSATKSRSAATHTEAHSLRSPEECLGKRTTIFLHIRSLGSSHTLGDGGREEPKERLRRRLADEVTY